MHTPTLFLLALFLFSTTGSLQLFGQEVVQIPSGQTPEIDGVISSEEWSDALNVTIETSGDMGSEVYVKHDGTSLYIAFIGAFSSSFLFPEIMIDPDNSKSSQWEEEDWWFHVSATDCESRGEPDNYDDCEVEQEDWKGIPNASPVMIPEAIEISIPFSKVGIGATLPDTVGMGFDLSNTATIWHYWPDGASRHTPSTWGTVILVAEAVSSVIEQGAETKQTELDLSLLSP